MLPVIHRQAQAVTCHSDRSAFSLPVHQPLIPRASILLIDNEAVLRQLLTTVLTQQGYRCQEAGNGLAGLAQLAISQPDLIILDINMPGMDGFEVLTRLRQQDRTLGVLMCSAQSAHRFASKAISAGADGYLTKPIQLPMLLQEVERIHEVVRLRRSYPPINMPRTTAPHEQ